MKMLYNNRNHISFHSLLKSVWISCISILVFSNCQFFESLGDGIYEGITISYSTSMQVSQTSMNESGRILAVAGSFNLAGGVFAQNIALYNLNTKKWKSLASNLDTSLSAVSFQSISNSVLIGGGFTYVNSTVYCPSLCVWKDGLWKSPANFTGQVLAIVSNPSNSSYYIGGKFTMINNQTVVRVAMWTGSNFVQLGNGLNADVLTLAFDRFQNILYAGGLFTQSGSNACAYLAMFNGNSWNTLPGVSVLGTVTSIYVFAPGSIIFGGTFVQISGQQFAKIAIASNGTFQRVGNETVNSLSVIRGVSAITVSGQTRFLVTGDLVYQGISCNVAMTNEQGLVIPLVLKFQNSQGYSLTVDQTTGDLFYGGAFTRVVPYNTSIGKECASGIVRFTQNPLSFGVSSGNWNELNGGTDASILAIARSPDQQYLGVVGQFTSFGNTTAQFAAYNDGTNWNPLVPNPGSDVMTIAFDGISMILGSNLEFSMFPFNDTTMLRYFISNNSYAYFDYNKNPHVKGSVYAIAVNYSSGDIYVGGSIVIADSGVVNIAIWGGSYWDAMSGISIPTCDGPIYALAMSSNSEFMYVGGSFQGCGPESFSSYVAGTTYIAKFSRTMGWFRLTTSSVNSPQGSVRTILADPFRDFIYFGGTFSGVTGYAGGGSRVFGYNATSLLYVILGNGLNGNVWKLDFDNVTKFVFAGGEFYLTDSTTGQLSSGLAYYANGTWRPFANTNYPVRSLLIDNPTESLIVSGTFTRIQGVCASNFASMFPILGRPFPTPQPTPVPTPKPTPPTLFVPTPTPTTLVPTTSQTTSSSALTSSGSGSSGLIGGIVGAAVGLLLICFIVILVIILVRRKRRNQNSKPIDVAMDSKPSQESDYVTQKTTNYASLSAVTQDRSSSTNQYAMIGANERAALSESLQGVSVPFDHLEIVKQLGTGNFGVVNLAKYKGKLIAAKQLKPESGMDAASASEALKKYSKSMQEFVSEAKLLAKIPPSPYVISLVGICAEPFAILTEYLDGGSLLEHLQKQIDITKGEATQFLKEILMGVMHLHENGIIHRDLAARNVLLRNNPPNAPQCVLTDMGLARLYDRETTYQKTKSATFPLRWSAPELLKDKKSSEKSDIWSWAVVSIEIFSRSIPFPEYSPMEFALALVSDRFQPTANVNTPNELKPLINKCFSKVANERPSAKQIFDQWPF